MFVKAARARESPETNVVITEWRLSYVCMRHNGKGSKDKHTKEETEDEHLDY